MSEFIPLLESSQCGKSKVLYVCNSATVDELRNAAESRCEAALGLLELLAAGDYRATHVSLDVRGIALLVSDALSLYTTAFEKIEKA